SNVYVSATKGVDRSESDLHKYRRAEHKWMISVEPHQHHTPLIHKEKHPEPYHFFAVWDETSQTYDITSTGAEDHEGIIGNILVSDHAKTNIDEMKALLVTRLRHQNSSLPSEATSPEEPEHWIRVALHALQDDELVERFDVGEFMTFAHAFIANRLGDNGAPAMVAYPVLHKDHEKKKQHQNFWL
ncbi:hypothetical protein K431DRAFT_197493, partial [Polychaeton citri CBS 116435]